MNKYQVYYAMGTSAGLTYGPTIVTARDEQEAKVKAKSMVPGSWGHWVDRQNEVGT